MKAGDKVKLIGIPPNLRDEKDMQTRTLFEKCLGQSFMVIGVLFVEGLPYPVAKLDVGHVLGGRTVDAHNPQYLQLENP